MKKHDLLREALRQNRYLYYRYCFLSAFLLIVMLVLLFVYVFFF